MSPNTPGLGVRLSITYVGTACAVLHIEDDHGSVNFITDPVFSPAGKEWDFNGHTLKTTKSAALGLADMPPIDAVLLSHEDHVDNLDEHGRQLLEGRHVLTTSDGAKQLAPRPGVRALLPWKTQTLNLGGRRFDVTGTPCVHLPGGEVTGFIVTTQQFGETDGKPNAIYFSGDTIYLPELAKMRDSFHISVALLNIGKVLVPTPDGELLQITLSGADASRLFKEIAADLLVPMHYESWAHFAENKEVLAQELEREGVRDRVVWLEPGAKKKIVV